MGQTISPAISLYLFRMYQKQEPYWPLILLLAIIKLMLPVLIADPVYELHRDEYLYYQQGLHPVLGYM